MSIQLSIKLVPIPGIPKIPGLSPLGLLSQLTGTWVGKGFNQIFRPNNSAGSDNFLELNLTNETLEFTEIPGEIANRGLLQSDISLFGLTYLQQVTDANVKDTNGNPAGIHIEPGIWINVPSTTNPSEVSTVARLANIPHGTSLVAQGTATAVAGPPVFPAVDITPFAIGQPNQKIPFPGETTLATPSAFRSPPANIVGVTQAMVDNPNSVLAADLVGRTITSTTVIQISTAIVPNSAPNAGGGTDNIAFLTGGPAGPNARAVQMEATFWISSFTGSTGSGTLLQYSQLVLLNFNGLSWPHVSVATLIKHVTKVKPEIKESKLEIKEHKPEIKENKPEIKEHKSEIKEHKSEIKEHKIEAKELEVPNQPVPIPDPGPAQPAESAPPAGRPFIAPEERPAVGDAVLKDNEKKPG